MKKFYLILFISALLYFLPRKCEEDKIQKEKQVAKSEKISATDFYSRYPLKVIPYQIPYSDYILEIEILNIDYKSTKNAFTKSHDQYTIDGHEDGMSLNIKYSIKNPYKNEMWIPLQPGLVITSDEYPKENNYRHNSIHPHKDFYSDNSKFLGREPNYKYGDLNDKLYYIKSESSFIMEDEFKLIPYTENLIICGIGIFTNSIRFEKGIIMNIKQNSIVGQEIFKDYYYND